MASSHLTITDVFNETLDTIGTVKYQEKYHSETAKVNKDLLDNLEKLKLLAREKTIDISRVDKKNLDVLVELSREGFIEAKRCIYNLIFNYESIRNSFIDKHIELVAKNLLLHMADRATPNNYHGSEITEELEYDMLCLDMKIIGFLSGFCPSSRGSISESLLKTTCTALDFELSSYNDSNRTFIIEILKVLFNLTLEKSTAFDNSLPIIKRTIRRLFELVTTSKPDLSHLFEISNSVESKGTHFLIVHLIHLLVNMDHEIYCQLEEEDGDTILNYIEEMLWFNMSIADLRSLFLPAISVGTSLCEFNEKICQNYYRRIFSSTKNFEKRPEEYDNLRGLLVKLMTHVDIVIKETVSLFLFTVCGNDTEKLITYTGFGNSVAFLSSQGLLSSNSAVSSTRNKSKDRQITNDLTGILSQLNPVTGRKEEAKSNATELMSEEEKEVSALELADAIDRLSKLGIIKPAKVDSTGKITELQPNN